MKKKSQKIVEHTDAAQWRLLRVWGYLQNNSKLPSVEVLHFKKEIKDNKISDNKARNKSDTKSNLSIPSNFTQNTENSETSKPLIPK